ncbi:MAG: SDR family oxidoreductase [Alphaproteobacteria bacterium]|nr:SDR family oxidoreductase [Alphaproteobacteria bacterium]
MKVLITGGGGFIGQRLARALSARGSLAGPGGRETPIEELILLDVEAPRTEGLKLKTRAVAGDISDAAQMRALIDPQVGGVFHLAAVVSGGAEQDFDLGYRINLDGTRYVLEACRHSGAKPRVVFTSSVAAYGGAIPETVTDDTPPTPETSYGAQKVMGELLVSDYSRKGFLDGRSLRLPTIVVRPGKPNKAASSFASGIIREPLTGQEAICPVDREVRHPILSPRKVVEALIRAHQVDAKAFRATRTITLPGQMVSIGAMVEALARVAGAKVAERIKFVPDPFIQRIVATWPKGCDSLLARKLGFEHDPDIDSVIRGFVEDELGGRIAV